MVPSSTSSSELQALIDHRPAYQKLARIVRPITAAARRKPGKTTPPGDLPYVNEKQEAWLQRSYRWWRLYRSITRALDMLSRVYSSNAFSS